MISDGMKSRVLWHADLLLRGCAVSYVAPVDGACRFLLDCMENFAVPK